MQVLLIYLVNAVFVMFVWCWKLFGSKDKEHCKASTVLQIYFIKWTSTWPLLEKFTVLKHLIPCWMQKKYFSRFLDLYEFWRVLVAMLGTSSKIVLRLSILTELDWFWTASARASDSSSGERNRLLHPVAKSRVFMRLGSCCFYDERFNIQSARGTESKLQGEQNYISARRVQKRLRNQFIWGL